MNNRGLIQVYTGWGKGKTTAALGLCLRAAGHGLKCAFVQFLKGRETGEMISCSRISPRVVFEQYGTETFVMGNDTVFFEQQRIEAEKGLFRSREILESGEFNVVVLDEIVTLPALKVCGEEMIIQLLELDRGMTELILTGRGAWDELVRRADLVTEMKEVKHYFNSGVQARKGIEY